jgi:hypothetical protein
MHQQLPRTERKKSAKNTRQRKKNLDAAISSEAETIAGAAKVVTH